MKNPGILFLIIAFIISCENIDEKENNNYPISDGAMKVISNIKAAPSGVQFVLKMENMLNGLQEEHSFKNQ